MWQQMRAEFGPRAIASHQGASSRRPPSPKFSTIRQTALQDPRNLTAANWQQMRPEFGPAQVQMAECSDQGAFRVAAGGASLGRPSAGVGAAPRRRRGKGNEGGI